MNISRQRICRINDVLQKRLVELIRDECNDPRLGMITVSSVEVSSNLGFAKVYVTVMQDDKIRQSLQVLNSASGFLRKQLCQKNTLKSIPKLQFFYDESLKHGNHMYAILNSLCSNKLNHSNDEK